MLEELRLYPRSPAARTEGCCRGDGAAIDWRGTVLDLSTGFAELPAAPLHRRAEADPQQPARIKEEVG